MFPNFDDNSFSEGDTIVYTSHEKRPEGRIYSIDRVNDTVEIEWTTDMDPKRQTFTRDFINSDHVKIIKSLPFGLRKKCTCGVDTVGEGLHSDYCDKY